MRINTIIEEENKMALSLRRAVLHQDLFAPAMNMPRLHEAVLLGIQIFSVAMPS